MIKLTPQKPPYYENVPAQAIRLQTNVQQITTPGTATVTVAAYTIPANTFQKNGDTLEYDIIGVSDTNNTDVAITFFIVAQALTFQYSTNFVWAAKCRLTRIADDTVLIVIQPTTNGGVDQLTVSEKTGMNFANTIVTQWRLRAPTSGTATTKLSYINKQTQH